MPTTPTLLLPYPLPTDPADVPLDMQELADRIEAVRGLANGLASLAGDGKVPLAQLPNLGGSYGAAPPASPATGDLWYLPVAGGVWQFRYNGASGSPYKWEFVGGPYVVNYVGTVESRTTGGYGDLPTIGPRLQAPRAGEYETQAQAQMVAGADTAGAKSVTFLMQTLAETAGAFVGTPFDFTYVSSPAGSISVRGGMESQPVVLQANEFIRMQYAQNQLGDFQGFGTRRLMMRPVRVS